MIKHPSFKVDENLPLAAAEFLRNAGHDASTVFDEGLGGTADPELIDACRRESRTLLTLDMGFANILVYPPKGYDGIIVLRLSHQDVAHVISAIAGCLSFLNSEPLEGRLWIVEKDKIRVRE